MGTGELLDVWAIWPDTYMAPWHELDIEIINGRSDDVQKVVVTEYDETASPSKWYPINKVAE